MDGCAPQKFRAAGDRSQTNRRTRWNYVQSSAAARGMAGLAAARAIRWLCLGAARLCAARFRPLTPRLSFAARTSLLAARDFATARGGPAGLIGLAATRDGQRIGRNVVRDHR